MGTVFSVHVNDPGDWSAALARVVAFLHRVDRVFSTYQPGSQLSRLARREIRLRECAPAVAEVLALCTEVTRRSGGYFSARFDGGLDPTGMVKGWAIERASALLTAAGARSHGVNGGGDMQLVGGLGDGRPWRVGIADPLRPGSLATTVSAYDVAVATSGSAERGCHVLDPRTGRPPRGLASVTVTGPSITFADAYATAAYAMGPAAQDWVAGLADYQAFGVTDEGSCWFTPGFPFAAAALAAAVCA